MKTTYLQECCPCTTTCQSFNDYADYDIELELMMLDTYEEYDRQIAEKYSADGDCYDSY